ncbi:hypothetical protein OSTOST_25244, partial [Ostertagia ostertagi]
MLRDAPFRASWIQDYKRECKNLEEVVTRILGPKLEKNILAQLMPKHTSTPTYYQLVKTHKLVRSELDGTVDTTSIKTRPIVASCGGPTDRISWFLQRILCPLLQHVSSHLKNVRQFLEQLRQCNFQQQTTTALYTNVDTQRAVESCIRLLRLHHQELQLFDLNINDMEELLRTVVEVNIFRFRNRFYKQKRGLAMGSRLAPLLAIVFMDSLERQALSSGILYFGRYIDDIFIVGKTRAALRETFSKLNSAHESIQLTSEEPSPDGFLPFLNTKVRIMDGQISAMWYKKGASRNILIHARSCHPLHMVRLELVEVMTEVDEILRQNGYKRGQHRTWKPCRSPSGTPLLLPFITDEFAMDIGCRC